MMNKFSPEVIDKLNYYVYRLIDPRNGETFYVGKGKGNRVFDHAKAAQAIEAEDDQKDDDDENKKPDLKLSRIRAVRNAGLEVIHVIHRHGMDEPTALEVEACLIDAIPGLTNIMGGTGSNDFGPMHASEIEQRYSVQEVEVKHKLIFININVSANEEVSIYEATRKAWRMSQARAEKAEVVLANYKGLVVGVFVPQRWYEHHRDGDKSMRIAFEGKEADPSIRNMYLNKQVPAEYRKRGASNPVKYSY